MINWTQTPNFNWCIPEKRKHYYNEFTKTFEVTKYASIGNALNCLDFRKFMNGDASYNSGVHTNWVDGEGFWPYLDHAVVFQGNKPWKRVMTSGDYVNKAESSEFCREFAACYGLENIYYPSIKHWRNGDMRLCIWTTSRYKRCLLNKGVHLKSHNFSKAKTLEVTNGEEKIHNCLVTDYIKQYFTYMKPVRVKRVSHCEDFYETSYGNYPFAILVNNGSVESKLFPIIEES